MGRIAEWMDPKIWRFTLRVVLSCCGGSNFQLVKANAGGDAGCCNLADWGRPPTVNLSQLTPLHPAIPGMAASVPVRQRENWNHPLLATTCS